MDAADNIKEVKAGVATLSKAIANVFWGLPEEKIKISDWANTGDMGRNQNLRRH